MHKRRIAVDHVQCLWPLDVNDLHPAQVRLALGQVLQLIWREGTQDLNRGWPRRPHLGRNGLRRFA